MVVASPDVTNCRRKNTECARETDPKEILDASRGPWSKKVRHGSEENGRCLDVLAMRARRMKVSKAGGAISQRRMSTCILAIHFCHLRRFQLVPRCRPPRLMFARGLQISAIKAGKENAR